MEILTPGHKYLLANMEQPDPKKTEGQVIQFIEKKPSGVLTKLGKPSSFVTVNNGTTNEEVIRCLIDRLTHLYKKLPSPETLFAVHHLDLALCQLQQRTADRQARGVEGTPKA